ncbi:MetQ/NlpA family ABC transporter substrate-binding protein [Atopobacter phocae]|uniref:MetQ/NlpA family ABC transporter substrate-binding protein n=1 Tax=Atopobacter phocae TaxID=136492 RepID=UPI000470D37D|nr:MetQ/NlpA family ABC transporter substrate-binding protein [Atopobacter phocae]
MKKIFAALLFVLVLAGCGSKGTTETSSTDSKEKVEVIKVASHTAPMTTILEMIQDDLEKEGYQLEIETVTDNVQANVALQGKEVDANFFQHPLFMQMFNEKNGTDFVAVQPIYNAVVSFYGKDLKNIEDLKDGADIAVPSDPANLTRALRLLEQNDLIKLDDDKSYSLTLENIKENPKNLKFTEVGLLNLNEAYEEKDMVFNYPTYIKKLDLNPEENGLIFEKNDDLNYAISLVVNKEDEDSDKISALKKAMASDEVKAFLEGELKGSVIVSF